MLIGKLPKSPGGGDKGTPFSYANKHKRIIFQKRDGQMCIFLIFCFFSSPKYLSAPDSVPLHPIPPHSAPYIFPRPKGVVKYDTLPLFPKKNYPFPTISRISLDKSPSCLYNI